MSKLTVDAAMDAMLAYLPANVTELRVCSGDPADRAAAVTNTLAARTGLNSSVWTGPADGDTNGRKETKNAETGISITASGTAATICLCSGSILVQKTNVASQALTSGGTVDVNSFKTEVADAA